MVLAVSYEWLGWLWAGQEARVGGDAAPFKAGILQTCGRSRVEIDCCRILEDAKSISISLILHIIYTYI